jgi:hypothetical protein
VGHVKAGLRPRAGLVTAAAVVALVAAVGLAPAGASTAAKVEAKAKAKSAKALVGVFSVTAGTPSGATVTGSYFRMVQPNGTVAAGPYVPNGDSTATDKTYTPLAPGSSGGLVTGSYQPQPNPPFDAAGNGTATAIVTPTKFFGVQFALATNPTDPQTGQATKPPSLKPAKGGKLTGDLDALGVAYGKQHFNQGTPKPDGTRPGATSALTGTYNAKTHAYTLDWSSAIVGGPFNGFTGVWHLEGTFTKGKK